MTRCIGTRYDRALQQGDHIMKIGLVGLGRMGAAMSQRLREHGFDVVGWDMNADRNKADGQ